MTDYEALGEEFKASPGDLDKHLPRVLAEIEKDDSENAAFIKECRWPVEDDLFDAAKTAKNKHEKLIVPICVASFRKKKKLYYKLAKKIFEEKTLVKWKGHEAAIEEICSILQEPIEWVPEEGRENHVSWSDSGGSLKDAVEQMIRACSRDKVMKKVMGSFARLLSACLLSGATMHVVVALPLVDASEMSWEDAGKLIPEVLEAFNKWLQRDDLNLEEDLDQQELARGISGVMEHAGKTSSVHIKSILEFCVGQELEGEELPLSIHGEMCRNIINNFILRNHDKVKQFVDLMPYVVKLLSCDVKELEDTVGYVVGTLYQNAELLAPYGEAIVDAYLDNRCEGTTLGLALKGVYKSNPDAIVSRMDRLAERIEDMASSEKSYIYMMLDDVCKKNPEAIAPHIDLLIEDITDPTAATQSFMCLAEVSIHYPKKFVQHIDRCVKAWEQSPYVVASACKMLASIGRISKEKADECLKILFGKVKSIDPMWISVILMEVKRIGQAHKDSLRQYRADIEGLKTCQQMGVADMVQAMIDFLDDRTLQGLSEDVAEQRDDIDNLDSRVTNTENDITRIDETVAQQGDDIQNVKNNVTEQGEKLDELKEVVDETVEKVEEIDHKTITNAPKWSRDVSKLLNPEHEHDWRFLAVRLGYSGEDIRNWALSPDPTMAILAEWYTTHKSSDATYAILSALEDMGRTDAAEIINQSLEEAELLVPKAPPEPGEKPPAVFLSYQWDHQPEVKAIKKHLEMAGFPCWMDIGQMGGGDQLFARISQGMRSSKLVLCMVTEKYSNSENCNKEVNLANLLNKPIIPILIDRTPWPPEGAMSMLFAQLLYIQFYNEKEYVRGDKFWDDAKFSELLGQLSYHANPDQSMVAEEYKNWLPQVDDSPVVVKKVSEESQDSKSGQQSNNEQEPSEPPSVFISYQWGKQPEIKRLFSRLTSLGFHCWLDINQMGGGDPLYSKIDKGVRNAKVVISCVTPKYALSANCRREVSLSDALRKPILPLLLENMTWPPEGPMSMTFTQLLYIDFTKESSQKIFDDEKFDELLVKIKEHAQPTLDVATDGDKNQTESATPGVEESEEVVKVEPTSPPEPETNINKHNDKLKEPSEDNPNISEEGTDPASNTSSPSAALEAQEVSGTNQVPKEDAEMTQQGSAVEPAAAPESQNAPQEPDIANAPPNDKSEKSSRSSSAGKQNKKSKSCVII